MPQLTTNFSIDHKIDIESGVISVLSIEQNYGSHYKVYNEVGNGTIRPFNFVWDSEIGAWGQSIASNFARSSSIVGNALRAYSWTTYFAPLATLSGSITFTKDYIPTFIAGDSSWGGTYVAQRYEQHNEVEYSLWPYAGSPLITVLYTDGGQKVTFTNKITPSGALSPAYYDYNYQIINESDYAFNWSWAGFSGSIVSHNSWSRTVRSKDLSLIEIASPLVLRHPETNSPVISVVSRIWKPKPVAPSIAFASSSVTVNCFDPNAVVVVNVTGGQLTDNPSVHYYMIDGSAIDGVNYLASDGTLTIPYLGTGQLSGSISIPLKNFSDPAINPRNFFVALGSPVNCFIGDPFLMQVNIKQTLPPTPATLSFPVMSGYLVNVPYTAGHVDLVVSLVGGAPTSNMSVDYYTQPIMAVAGVNYVAVTGTATIPPGQQSVTISVPILNVNPMISLAFQVVLNNPVNCLLGPFNVKIVQINPTGGGA